MSKRQTLKKKMKRLYLKQKRKKKTMKNIQKREKKWIFRFESLILLFFSNLQMCLQNQSA